MLYVREVLLAAFLVVGSALVVYGVSLWSPPSAWIVAGVMTAGLGVLFTAESD